MKTGDLVKPGKTHLLYNKRPYGLVITHYPKDNEWSECMRVLWSNGEIEIEVPEWLEIISECR
jgi:hypothetical protein